MTFFTILFVLIALNGIMMLFSLKDTSASKAKKEKKSVATDSKIYPIDLANSKYKKAV